MKFVILLTLNITLVSAAQMKFCGKPVANISNSENVHLLVKNKQNKPKEIVVSDAVISKSIIDKMDEYDSSYICLTGSLALEEAVYFLKQISESEFY